MLRDYAHTPDALERAIDAVRPFAPGRLIVVFGCGGDRDRGKRPEMGAHRRSERADVAIVTSDNPRTEDPERILDDIEAGMHGVAHERIEDRRAAIARALAIAAPDDVVLLAGKGHETYQVRGTTKLPFDEREIVREIIHGESELMADAATPQASALEQPRFWTLDRVADALGDGPRGPTALARIATDTRSVGAGDCFVALKGEKFDAHDFLADAVAKGAAARRRARRDARRRTSACRCTSSTTRLVALGALARYRRRAWGRPVVGVVGTNGKTSTKELLRAALGSVLRVHATIGNYNNLVGVPLTLFALPDDADVAVIEMGTNQPGEVAALRAIVEPDIVVVTSIAEEHLEGLGDLEGVLREELSACDGVPVAVVPASQPEVVDAARVRARRTSSSAGLDAGDLRADAWGDRAGRAGMARARRRRRSACRCAACTICGTRCSRSPSRARWASRSTTSARGIAAMPAPPMRVTSSRTAR